MTHKRQDLSRRKTGTTNSRRMIQLTADVVSSSSLRCLRQQREHHDQHIPVTPSPSTNQRPKRNRTGRRMLQDALYAQSSASINTPSAHDQQHEEYSTTVTPFTIASSSQDYQAADVVVHRMDDEEMIFQDLHVPVSELRPSAVLTTGQCFHWKAIHDDKDTNHHVVKEEEESSTTNATTTGTDTSTTKTTTSSAWGIHNATRWIGILRRFNVTTGKAESMIVMLAETTETTLYRVLYQDNYMTNTESIIRDWLVTYFQLNVPLEPLYQQWSKSCPRLCQIATCIPGVRIIDQDPWECFISFICSSNNNIPRITQMLNNLRREYGSPLISYQDEIYYSFPSLHDLISKATEHDLKSKCGFGYRAKYIMKTIQQLQLLGGEQFLHELRTKQDSCSSEEVQEALLQFAGVGRKVADCVALFSLQQSNAIPVDVHVWQIARRDYGFEGIRPENKKKKSTIKSSSSTTTNTRDGDTDEQDGTSQQQQEQQQHQLVKSLTPTVYRQVGDLFRTRFPIRSGWAHSLLFVAELPSFQPILTSSLITEMEQFRRQEQELKQLKKRESKTKKEEDQQQQQHAKAKKTKRNPKE